MVEILDGSDHCLNIYWDNPDEERLEAVEIARLYEKSTPMAMIALNLSCMVNEMTGLKFNEFDLVVHHSPAQGASFCLAPSPNLSAEEQEEVETQLRGWFDEFALYASENPGVTDIDRPYCAVNFANIRCLMVAVRDLYAEQEDLFTTDDIPLRELDDAQKETLRQSGAECLRDPWVAAVMPQTAYSDKGAYERAAHFTGLSPLPCPFSAIEQAVLDSERAHDAADPARRKQAGYNPYGMRLH
jgi:hypothetical protein